MSDTSNQDARASTFQAGIMLHILELRERGGPTIAEWSRIAEFANALAEKADVMLFGGCKKGEAADLFNKTCKAVAILSFVPGGITLMGEHYESIPDSGKGE